MPELPLELLKQEIEYASANNDWHGAFEAYNIASEWLEGSGLSKSSPRIYSDYYNSLIKLKFLALNYFDGEDDYYDLLKNYFGFSQDIPGFDLWSKLEVQLISMNVHARDGFKGKMRQALEQSDSLLFSRQQYDDPEMPVKVSDWIKDIVSNLGLDQFDKLKKVEYLSNSRFVRQLQQEDKEKVRNLLDIYENLKISSMTPQGYENSVVMNIDGKVVVFNRGEAEEVNVSKIKDIQEIGTEINERGQIGEVVNEPPIPQTDGSYNPLEDLERALLAYSENSLEHKAIKQEISRLKSAKLREAQKSNDARS